MAKPRKASRPPKDSATAYARSVIYGEVPACKWVRLACERHARDRASGKWFWDCAASERAISFLRLLQHYKGEYAGQQFAPLPWQCFVVGSLFGWKQKKGGLRRFRYALVVVPRKNGKSFLGAGVGLLMLAGDGEPAAEVYSVATKEDQAKLLWNDGRQMVRFSPGAGDTFKRTVNEIRHETSASVWRPVGSDSETLDGLNPHGILADELHAWKSRALWDVLDSATGARRQPLFFQISTEGSVRDGIFDEQVSLSQAILSDQALADDAGANVFGLIFTIDDDDDPMAEVSWFKANPNLGCGKSLEYMRDQAAKAALSPGKMRDFLCKQLNKRAEKSVGGWLSMEKWDDCAGDALTQEQVLARVGGKPVFCGFDASRSQDLAAVAVLWFEGEMACAAWLFFTPCDSLPERERADRAPYSEWVKAGWMTTTDGNITDYRRIEADTIALLKTAKAEAFWYDPSHGHECALEIRDEIGITDTLKREDGSEWHQVSALAQTWGNFSRPYREIERRVIGGTFRHFSNPVARWNVQNAVPHVGPSENIMLHKGRSKGRIDGAVALGMAFAAQLTMPVAEESAYSKRGIITL